MLKVVISPSNLKTYQQCPRKFQAQYVTKELPWREAGAMTRGNILHDAMEDAVKQDFNLTKWPTEKKLNSSCSKCNMMYSQENKKAPCTTCYTAHTHAIGFLKVLRDLRDNGWIIQAEQQLATDGLGNSLGWWDKPPLNFMRSKLDIIATHPGKDFGIILDWKSGKPWDDETQLHINAMCAYPVTKLINYQVMFAYFDSGDVKPYPVRLDILAPAQFNKAEHLNSPLLPTLVSIENLKMSYERDHWPATKNRFCNWCDVTNCPHK